MTDGTRSPLPDARDSMRDLQAAIVVADLEKSYGSVAAVRGSMPSPTNAISRRC